MREENIPAEAIGGVRERSLAAEDALRLRIAFDLHGTPVCSGCVRRERNHVSLQLLHHVHAAFLGYVVQTQYGFLIQIVVLSICILVSASFQSLRSCSGKIVYLQELLEWSILEVAQQISSTVARMMRVKTGYRTVRYGASLNGKQRIAICKLIIKTLALPRYFI